jgi:hypothetical protein
MMSDVIINLGIYPGEQVIIVAPSKQVWVPATPDPMNTR